MKPRDIIPGNIITEKVNTYDSVFGIYVDAIVPWVIVACEERIRRRHSRSQATIDGWSVLLIGCTGVVKNVYFNERNIPLWKRMQC